MRHGNARSTTVEEYRQLTMSMHVLLLCDAATPQSSESAWCSPSNRPPAHRLTRSLRLRLQPHPARPCPSPCLPLHVCVRQPCSYLPFDLHPRIRDPPDLQRPRKAIRPVWLHCQGTRDEEDCHCLQGQLARRSRLPVPEHRGTGLKLPGMHGRKGCL